MDPQQQLLIGAALIAGAILLSGLISVAPGGGKYSISSTPISSAWVVGPSGAVYHCITSCSRVKYE